jgi:hypothetical protein
VAFLCSGQASYLTGIVVSVVGIVIFFYPFHRLNTPVMTVAAPHDALGQRSCRSVVTCLMTVLTSVPFGGAPGEGSWRPVRRSLRDRCA